MKSLDSILLKYERYYPDNQTRKVFNDILGFRTFCDGYDQVLEATSQFRLADMIKGKAIDDGVSRSSCVLSEKWKTLSYRNLV